MCCWHRRLVRRLSRPHDGECDGVQRRDSTSWPVYLLDTNVVSELRRARPHPAVLDWIQDLPAHQLHVSAVTVGEIQAGIEITREQDAAKAEELEAWLGTLLTTYSVLPVDADAFKVWAWLMHRKSDTLIQDALIASVAIVNRLTVVTRNVRDFQQMTVSILNPFNDPPTVHEGEGTWRR